MAGFFNTDFGCTCEIAGQEIQETVCGCNIKSANRLTATSKPCIHVCIAPIFANIAVTGIVLYTCSIKLIAMQLCRICTIEDANGINCCACIFQLLGAGNCCIGNSGVEFCPSGGNAIREYDHHFLAIHTATGIGITAAHKGFSRLHTSPDIRCASRVLRQSINCFFQRTLSCGIYHSPALPSLCFTAKSNNRHTVIALFRILFAHFVNEAVDRLLHGILAGIKIFSSFISIEVIRHRAGLIQHQYNIQRFRAGCLRYLIGNIGFQRQFCAITIDGFFHLNRAVFRSGHLRFQFGFFIFFIRR